MLIELDMIDAADEIPALEMKTDANSAVSALRTSKFPVEKNLVLDMARPRRNVAEATVKIDHVVTGLMSADPLTKELSERSETLGRLESAMKAVWPLNA